MNQGSPLCRSPLRAGDRARASSKSPATPLPAHSDCTAAASHPVRSSVSGETGKLDIFVIMTRHPARVSTQNGITNSMKTAISVEDALMQQADDAARELGISRSALVAQALRDFLRQRHRAQITEQLNRAYAEPSPAERILVRKMRAKFPIQDPTR